MLFFFCDGEIQILWHRKIEFGIPQNRIFRAEVCICSVFINKIRYALQYQLNKQLFGAIHIAIIIVTIVPKWHLAWGSLGLSRSIETPQTTTKHPKPH